MRMRKDPLTHVSFVSLFSHTVEPWELFSNLNNCSTSVMHVLVIWNKRVSRLLKFSFTRSINFCSKVYFAFECNSKTVSLSKSIPLFWMWIAVNVGENECERECEFVWREWVQRILVFIYENEWKTMNFNKKILLSKISNWIQSKPFPWLKIVLSS